MFFCEDKSVHFTLKCRAVVRIVANIMLAEYLVSRPN
jgi:hypothetical protein